MEWTDSRNWARPASLGFRTAIAGDNNDPATGNNWTHKRDDLKLTRDAQQRNSFTAIHPRALLDVGDHIRRCMFAGASPAPSQCTCITGPQWMILMASNDLDREDGVPVSVIPRLRHVDLRLVQAPATEPRAAVRPSDSRRFHRRSTN